MVACGSHGSEPGQAVQPADRLAALEKDPSSALAAAALHPTYKATYEMQVGSLYPAASPSPGASGGLTFSQKITVASRSPDYRWEIEVNGTASQGSPTHAIAVISGASGVLCIELPAPACYAVPPEYLQQTLNALNGSPLDQYRAALKDYDVTVLPRERIVGTETACFRWKPKLAASPTPALAILAEVSFEGCFTADGVPLRMFGGAAIISFEQKAIAFTTTVTDADVAAPYPVTSSPFPFPTIPPPTPRPSGRPTPTP